MAHYLSLRAKLILETTILIVTIFLIILALVSVTTVRSTMQNAEKATEDIHGAILTRGMTLVRNNSTALHIFALDNSFTSVQELVEQTVKEPTILYGIYMDKNRLPWVYATPSNPKGIINSPVPLNDSLSLWAVAQKNASYTQTIFGDEEIYEFTCPVMHNDETLGFIRYGISTNEMTKAIVRAKLEGVKARNQAIFYILLTGAFFTAVGYIIIQIMATKITKPINHLVKEAQMITNGDYSVKVEVESHDEIGRLAEEFELMRKKILEYTSELEKKNEELELKIAERTKELEESKQLAEEANQAKSEFLANMSHEIRTPMNAILGFAEVLVNEEVNPEKIDHLKTILSSGETLLKLINDILDFSKIESGKLELSQTTFSLFDMLHHIEQIFSLKAQKKGIQLRFTHPDKTPEFYKGDDRRINQILVNLLGNSFKFTSEGGIYVKAEYLDGNLILSIKDTGIGIKKEHQDKIFEPFVQADGSISRRYGGTGLGLVITSRLIEKMGGTLQLNSMEGVGTTFEITLPLPVEKAAPKKKMTSESSQLQNQVFTVGIIEDMPDERQYLNKILQRYGFITKDLSNNETIINEVLESDIDLILLDLIMEGKNGFEINDILKKDIRTAHIPVIACSGSDEVENAIHYGMLDYIRKPINQHLLLSRIEGALKQIDTLKNIYLIDDNEQLLKLYSNYLNKAGFVVQTFKSGMTALNQIEKGNIPDFIILDLIMPGMDGFDFLSRLRKNEQFKAIPTIIVTSKELSTDEINRLNRETLAIFSKGSDTEQEFLSFISDFFESYNRKGEQMVREWFKTIDKDEDLTALLRETIETLPVHFHKLEEAILHKDLYSIEICTHTLKGTCLNFHIEQIGEKARELNDLVRKIETYSLEVTHKYLELKALFDLIPKRYFANHQKYFEKEKQTTDISSHTGKVLIAEDVLANQKLLMTFLKKTKLSCSVADNGQIALDMMKEEKFDILLLDMQMPVLDGMGVLKELQENPTDYDRPYIIALTANALKGEAEKYLNAGCNSYLSKPVRINTLLALIDKALHQQNTD